MQRNIIAKYPARLQREVSLWMADGEGPKRIRERLTVLGITPLPHNTSFRAWRNNPVFLRLQDQALKLTAEVAEAAADWQIAESAGASGYAATAVFEVQRDLRRRYLETEDLQVKLSIATVLDRIARTFAGSDTEKLKELDRSCKRKFAELKAQKDSEAEARVIAVEKENDELRADKAEMAEKLAAANKLLADNGLAEKPGSADEFSQTEINKAKKLYGVK